MPTRQQKVAVLFGGTQYGGPQTLTLQPDNVAGLDTVIRQSAATTNLSGAPTLEIGEWNGGAELDRALIKFDLTSLPANALITSATLSLYCSADFSSNARRFNVYRSKLAWVLNQATWTIYSTGNNWTALGGFDPADCEQTPIGGRDFSDAETLNEFKDFVLTPTSKAALDLGNGWLIKAETEDADLYVFTSANGTAANRPKLVITYRLPL